MSEQFFILVLMIGVGFAVPPWQKKRRFLSPILVAVYLTILARYLFWRLTMTVLPASALSIEGIVPWIVLIAELLLWAETTLLSVVLCRRTDRSEEADLHEMRLSLLNPAQFAMVDVFIATYNEPIDVLEKTIAGSMALDWPKNRLNIYVLDDGKRDWLKNHCEQRGVIYLTRPDNSHAKAGNINAAIARSHAPFFLVLDADFVPKSGMLRRAMGFFDDPKIGIVQMPHHFFNSDPVQTNLDLRSDLPDEQRFFFDVIQPGRDGWDCAFCCGSNGIVRRAAIDSVGGRMPTDSVTEDMLLTLTLLRNGYITRYLGEKLAIGLAPENLDAYFVQRGRWAQGAIQIMYLKAGPFGKGLRFMQRILFIPSHWLSQSICQPIAMVTPAFFMLTGIPPLINATMDQILAYQAPAVAGGFLLMRYFGPGQFYPLSSTVQSVLQAFRIMPMVALTFIRPTGHSFKVTPKGSDAGVAHEDRFIIKLSLLIIGLTGLGLLLNANFETRIVEQGNLLPVVAFWAIVNMIILLLVITVAVPRPTLRTEERFYLDETSTAQLPDRMIKLKIQNISLSGALARLAPEDFEKLPQDTIWFGLSVKDVGVIPVKIRRQFKTDDGYSYVGVSFRIPQGIIRDRLIQKLFAGSYQQIAVKSQGQTASFKMMRSIWARNDGMKVNLQTVNESDQGYSVPDWLIKLIEVQNRTREAETLPPSVYRQVESPSKTAIA